MRLTLENAKAMLVPSMTYPEIFKELSADYAELFKAMKTKLHFAKLKMQRTNEYRLVETIHIKTARNNNWSVSLMIEPGKAESAFYVTSYDKIGLVAYNFIPFADMFFLVKYNTHFIKRYNQRMRLGEIKPAQTIKHFFKNNILSKPGCSEEKSNDGSLHTCMALETGLAFGKFYPEYATLDMRTFIPTEMLNKGQYNGMQHLIQQELVVHEGNPCEVVVSTHH